MSAKTANDFTKPVVYTVNAADGSTQSYTVRVLVSKIVSISGYGGTMVIGSDESLWAMGYNKNGQIGNGTKDNVPVPTRIFAGGVAAVSGGLVHSVILKTDHSLWVTGYNNNGELGIGNAPGVLSPVQARRPSLAARDE